MLSDLNNNKVLLVGFAATNKSLLKAIEQRAPEAKVSIADADEKLEVPDGIEARLGDKYLDDLDVFDAIVRSPSVRYWPELEAVREKVTTATNLFFEEVRGTSKARIIGVTGTKGKSTTVSLLHEVITENGGKSLLVGNIDNQDWDVIDQIDDGTVVVYEMSSYMLQDFTGRPDIAVLLSLFPDHTDWHGSFEDYRDAKLRIAANQLEGDVLFVSDSNDPPPYEGGVRGGVKLEIVDTSAGKDFEAPSLLGKHNQENLRVVEAIAQELGIDRGVVEAVAKSFKGLPHRLEHVGTFKGIEFYDDAISTTPESTIAAIESFGKGSIGAIILGGLDRGYDFGELAKALVEFEVSTTVLLPGSRDRIKDALGSMKFEGEVLEAASMNETVAACFESCEEGQIALLSTAAPSYDMFKDYKDQGAQFKGEVERYPH